MGTLRLGNDVVVPSVTVKELVDKQKFNISIDNFIGDVDSTGIYIAPTEDFDFVADSVKNIRTNAFYGTFAYKSIASASFPILTTISGSNACYYMFGYSKLSSISFPVLTTISGASVCSSMFSSCFKLSSVSFPTLTTISGSNACSSMFSSCSNLTSALFPALTTISGNNACYYMFSGCTSLISISFPALTIIENPDCMPANMFRGCSKLTEIHFRKDVQTTVEAQAGYESKFGAANATIYFDL